MITFKEAVQFNYFHVKIRRQNLQCQDFLYIVVLLFYVNRFIYS